MSNLQNNDFDRHKKYWIIFGIIVPLVIALIAVVAPALLKKDTPSTPLDITQPANTAPQNGGVGNNVNNATIDITANSPEDKPKQ